MAKGSRRSGTSHVPVVSRYEGEVVLAVLAVEAELIVNNNNNNNNSHDNVYGAVILPKSLREFTRFI